MTFKKDSPRHFIGFPLLFSFLLLSAFGLKAQVIETELPAEVEDIKSQAVTQDNEENLEETHHVKEIKREKKPSETIVFGSDRRTKPRQAKKLPRKDTFSSMADIGDGMVTVEGEELIISDAPEKIETPTHSGVGRNMLTASTGDSSGKSSAIAADISLIAFDNSQRQSGTDGALLPAVTWFNNALLKAPLSPLIRIEQYYPMAVID